MATRPPGLFRQEVPVDVLSYVLSLTGEYTFQASSTRQELERAYARWQQSDDKNARLLTSTLPDGFDLAALNPFPAEEPEPSSPKSAQAPELS